MEFTQHTVVGILMIIPAVLCWVILMVGWSGLIGKLWPSLLKMHEVRPTDGRDNDIPHTPL